MARPSSRLAHAASRWPSSKPGAGLVAARRLAPEFRVLVICEFLLTTLFRLYPMRIFNQSEITNKVSAV